LSGRGGGSLSPVAVTGLEVVLLFGNELELKRVDCASESPDLHMPHSWVGGVTSVKLLHFGIRQLPGGRRGGGNGISATEGVVKGSIGLERFLTP